MLVLRKNFHIVFIAVYEALQPFLYPSDLSGLCCLQIFKKKSCQCPSAVATCFAPHPLILSQNQYATVLEYEILSHSPICIKILFLNMCQLFGRVNLSYLPWLHYQQTSTARGTSSCLSRTARKWSPKVASSLQAIKGLLLFPNTFFDMQVCCLLLLLLPTLLLSQSYSHQE